MEEYIINRQYEEVYAKINEFLKEKELHIFSDINQKEYAEQVGLQLNKITCIVFGNPAVGTYLMQDDENLAVDLPLKIILIEKDNSTKIIYEKPSTWLKENHTKKTKDILYKMNSLYENLINNLK